MKLWQEWVQSSIGTIGVVTLDQRLCSLDFQGYEARMLCLLQKRFGHVDLYQRPRESWAAQAVRRYFAGELNAFDSIDLYSKGTPFQSQVWQELMRVPPGLTVSYQTIAENIGKPRASRAVGMANRSNPIALAIPCHRVIAKSGALGGYAGGVEKKEWLFDHERKWS